MRTDATCARPPKTRYARLPGLRIGLVRGLASRRATRPSPLVGFVKARNAGYDPPFDEHAARRLMTYVAFWA